MDPHLHAASGAQHRRLYPDEEARRCLVILAHITYLGVIRLLHLFQQDPKRLQVEADVLGFLQAWARGETSRQGWGSIAGGGRGSCPPRCLGAYQH